MRERFTFHTITERTTFEDEPDESGDLPYEQEYDEGEPERGDLRAALDALCSVYYFDSLDMSGSTTIIGYAADATMDSRTGAYERDTIIVDADRPENADRLLAAFDAKRKADEANFQAYLDRTRK